MTTAIASFLTAAAVERVRFAEANGGRAGTLYASAEALAAAFGGRAPAGEKTSAEWYFETPAGPVAVWGYKWNGAEEWSLVGSGRAVRAFAALFDGVEGFRTERRPHARLAA